MEIPNRDADHAPVTRATPSRWSIKFVTGASSSAGPRSLAHRQHIVPPPMNLARADEVMDGLDDLTGSHVRHEKRYRVRPANLESFYGNSDKEEELQVNKITKRCHDE